MFFAFSNDECANYLPFRNLSYQKWLKWIRNLLKLVIDHLFLV